MGQRWPRRCHLMRRRCRTRKRLTFGHRIGGQRQAMTTYATGHGLRRPASGRTLTRTPARMAVFELLLSEPGATWTVAEVCSRLQLGRGPSIETVRATLYVL